MELSPHAKSWMAKLDKVSYLTCKANSKTAIELYNAGLVRIFKHYNKEWKLIKVGSN